ncbi:MAG: L-lactate dehydrogenase [Bacilli bacterium]|nr:L-lactate dehydrogenase [Bacilli bacterium]
MKKRKVVIIGDGAVGSTTAFVLATGSTVKDLVIIDVNQNKTEGDVADIKDGMSFISFPKRIKAGDYSECADARLIIITAGAAQKEGETRLDLLKKNYSITKSICASLKPYVNEESLVMVVTNPCDILTYIVQKELGLPYNHVFGSGTVLDTSRLKTVISETIGVDSRNVHTYVLGEHGDSEVPIWSMTSIGGLSILDYCSKNNCLKTVNLDEMFDQVRYAAYEIIKKKGATNYAVALAVSRIVNAVINDEHSILTCSIYCDKEFSGELDDIYLSLPCVVSGHGISGIIRPNYTRREQMAIISSGEELKEKLKEIL